MGGDIATTSTCSERDGTHGEGIRVWLVVGRMTPACRRVVSQSEDDEDDDEVDDVDVVVEEVDEDESLALVDAALDVFEEEFDVELDDAVDFEPPRLSFL